MRALALALALWGGAAGAQDCRLALLLALDVSSSVDASEDRLQREGLAAALRSPAVARAMLSGGTVALHAFEWSGRREQATLLPGWQVIASDADIERVADAVGASRRGKDGLETALGEALGFASGLFDEAPDCRTRILDVAGDGIGNDGLEPEVAYALFPFDGVTVNALIVGDVDGGPERREEGRRLVAWYQAEVLRGPGAFSLVAEGYEDYARAMEAKLLRELTMPVVGEAPPGGRFGNDPGREALGRRTLESARLTAASLGRVGARRVGRRLGSDQ